MQERIRGVDLPQQAINLAARRLPADGGKQDAYAPKIAPGPHDFFILGDSSLGDCIADEGIDTLGNRLAL